MKLVTFTAGGSAPRVGALSEDEAQVIDLAAGDNQPYFQAMLALIDTYFSRYPQRRTAHEHGDDRPLL